MADLFTEQADIDPDTLANLGPLRALAGTWRGEKGLDLNPNPGPEGKQAFVETIDLQPIDPQSNGPQLLYGLRYHTRIVKPGEVETYHDQVGYWLWEPDTGQIIHTLTIPRGQTALALGQADKDARTFEVRAERGTPGAGICSAPFLDENFRTDSFRMTITAHEDGSWSYEEETVLKIKGQRTPFRHVDSNRLTKVAEPKPNPAAG